MGFPNRGEGGRGVPDLGKIPTFSRFFFLDNIPYGDGDDDSGGDDGKNDDNDDGDGDDGWSL